ncbi:MAG: hypothetical protein QOI98_1186 [Solirubrobacteraceae bacterium]|jgi:uncharacterized protein|nr:hypothetical protein [Solirubrobacteraceae bacterium]
MPIAADSFDLATLRLTAGEGRRLELETGLEALAFGGQTYVPTPSRVPVVLDVARTTGRGYSMRLRFETTLLGPCMRCLEDASHVLAIDSREVDQPGGGEELSSPYVEAEVLDVAAWARDALALATPDQVLCRPDCAGLCPVCGADLNVAGPEHAHERAPDPRWAKLRELG